jgi:hypothetical protein
MGCARSRKAEVAMVRPASIAALLAVGLATALYGQIPEQYPKPLTHTATNHPASHILLVSVDGLHAFDLATYVAAHPASTLAKLSAHGVTYTNAHAPWADPIASFVSLVTGGTPISTGIVATHAWDHSLSPAGSACRTHGALLSFDQQYRKSQSPLDPASDCKPLEPHTLLRVNTIFEVVHSRIGPTAWAGESEAATDLLRGPSGQGLTFAEAIPAGESNIAIAQSQDEARLHTVLAWLNAKEVPALFGLSLTSFAAAQSAAGVGYLDSIGTPSSGLAHSLDVLDVSLAQLVSAIAAKKLTDSTWIVVTAPYGQSRVDPVQRRIVSPAELAAAMAPAVVARVSGGAIATIWLQNPADAPAAARALQAKATTLGIADIYTGARLNLIFNPAKADPRSPDIILQPNPNVVYAAPGSAPTAVHGGLSDWDTHVAMLVSGAKLGSEQGTGRTDPTWVPTTQLAPLLLRALGMEKFDLDALHHEHTPALPGIF